MPLAAFGIAKLMSLSPELMVGMVLVGTTAGGTASNVICYLAKGEVALSITLTTTSTLLAVVLMPYLTWIYVGQTVPVPILAMLLNILKIIVLPVLIGTTLNTLFGRHLGKIKGFFPLLSMLAIVIIIAIIIGLNQEKLAQIGLALSIAIILHNAIGLMAGYWIPALFGYDNSIRRTLAIEVGMQNSGLSVALAIKHFSIISALPGAMFSIWHNLSGSFLAGLWGSRKNSSLASLD